jgi:hypothetical protein
MQSIEWMAADKIITDTKSLRQRVNLQRGLVLLSTNILGGPTLPSGMHKAGNHSLGTDVPTFTNQIG